MYESLTDSPMNKKLCFCLYMALLAAFVMPEKLRAQRPDFTTWLNVGAEYELKKSGFTLESGLEWRTKDHFRQTDRVGWNVDGSYQLLPWLKVGMGYELHLRNLDEEEWGFRHRYKLHTRWTGTRRTNCACAPASNWPTTCPAAAWSLTSRWRCTTVWPAANIST